MFFLVLLQLLGCSKPEASEPPLPDGAGSFRAALQSFHAMRMWIRAPKRNDITGGRFWFGEQFVLSVNRAGVATVDKQGQGSRYRWAPSGHTSDVNVRGLQEPPESRLPDSRDFAGIAHSEHWVAQVIGALRSPETVWRARSPGHYGWGVQTDEYAEVTLPALEPSGCHLFLRFGDYDSLRTMIVQCSRKQVLSLTVLRLEVDPPLPPTWFDADAPEFDTTTRGEFQAGEPTLPQDPGFYAPGASPPLAWRGVAPGGQ